MPERDFFGQIWDRGLGIFDRLADLEITKLEIDAAADVFAFREAQAMEAERRQAQFVAPTGGGVGAGFQFDQSTLLIVGAAVVGLVLLTRN